MVVLVSVSVFLPFLPVDASAVTLGVMMAQVTVPSLLDRGLVVVPGNRVAHALRNLPAARRPATRLAGIAPATG